MNKKDNKNLKRRLTNFFGAVGYFVCSLQWAWMLMLNFSLIKAVVSYLSQNSNTESGRPLAGFDLESNLIFIILAAVVVVMIVSLAIYNLITMPAVIAKTGKAAVQQTAKSLAPVVIKAGHIKDTKKRRLVLTSRLVLTLKVFLITVPFAFSYTSKFLQEQFVDYYAAMYVSVLLLCFSLICFTIQYVLGRVLSVEARHLW